jgi:hypothetical protein
MINQSQVISNAGKSESHVGFGVACGLALIVAAFLIAMQPTFKAAHAKAQALVTEEIARENTTFCEKRGFTANAREHEDCVRDLNELRANQDKRTSESAFGML